LVSKDTVSRILSINYEGFIPILWEAIKVQQGQIQELQTQLDEVLNSGTNANARQAKETENGVSNSLNSSEESSLLHQNIPNPANGSTEIRYSIRDNVTQASLHIYSLNGRQLKSYDLPIIKAKGSINISSADFGAGVFLYSLIVDGKEEGMKKMIIR